MAEQSTNEIIAELRAAGPWFWEARDCAPSQALLELDRTRETFLAVLRNTAGGPDAVVDAVLSDPDLPTRLAVKHAMIACDLSAELLDRVREYFREYQIGQLNISLPHQTLLVIRLQHLPKVKVRLGNKAIERGSVHLHRDILFVTLYGAFAQELNFPTFGRCRLGALEIERM